MEWLWRVSDGGWCALPSGFGVGKRGEVALEGV